MSEGIPEFLPRLLRQFYLPFCVPSEVDRVLEPKSASDYLLSIRAQYIADHMRVFRYFRRQRANTGNTYSLEGCFGSEHYELYLAMLSPEDRFLLKDVYYGDVYTSEADGEIFTSPFGPIVTISRSLLHFLEFGHLAMGAFYSDIPMDVRFRALLIALRVMFGYESLDFHADPRGNIDPFLLAQMENSISLQMQFIAGHEFAHHLLGHLSDANTHSIGRRAALGTNGVTCTAYSTSQQQEFEADITSLTRPQLPDEPRSCLIHAACMWFGLVELFEHARDVISPIPAWRRSHPSARDRHLHIQATLSCFLSEELIENSAVMLRSVDIMKAQLTDYLTFHIEDFEMYGSMYLSDEPDTAWRGPIKIDRVDYY